MAGTVNTMKHRNSHLLIGYWSRLRRGRAVPDQCDIDPRAIKRMLSFVFILDAVDTMRPVYRLAGTSLCHHFGTELKGLSFLAHWEEGSRRALAGLLQQGLALQKPLCLSSVAATPECGMAEVETTLAPVTFGEVKPTRFLGLVQILGDADTLAGRPIAFERLAGSQFVEENQPLAPPDFPLPPYPVTSFPPASGHPKAPHLRLVVNRNTAAPDAPDQVQNGFTAEGQPADTPMDALPRLLDVYGTGISIGK